MLSSLDLGVSALFDAQEWTEYKGEQDEPTIPVTANEPTTT